MRWFIPPKFRCDIIGFSGINFSGHQSYVAIHPVGGRQGDELDGLKFRSVAITGDLGTRVVFRTTELEEGWEDRPWRALVIQKGSTYSTKEARFAVRIPDLDWLDDYNARRCDPDFQASFPMARTLADGEGEWTYGNAGVSPLKDNIRAIHLDKI